MFYCISKTRLIFHLWIWSYEYETIDLEDYIIKCEPSPSNTSLPSFGELDKSVDPRNSNPPSRAYSDDSIDKELFERLEKQKNTSSLNSYRYNSDKWDRDRVLDKAHREKAVYLAEKSGHMGKDGYNIKLYTRGQQKGERRVCINASTVMAPRLLVIIKR